MQPETDLEYLFHGDTKDNFDRLASLDLLSDEGLRNMPELRRLVDEIKEKHATRSLRFGPGYVHWLAALMIEREAVNGYGLYLHLTGPRSDTDRKIDEQYMKWIGEEEKCKEIQDWWFDEDNPRDGNDNKSGLEI